MSANSNPPEQPISSDSSLQFDRAEFSESAALSCSFCKAPVAGQYFQVNSQTACPNCRGQIDSAFSGGSKSLRTLRAMGAGFAAAAAGFLIYWAVRALTGYEFALISILIGFMVGGAVRWGAQARGGVFYQLMAVVLTYLSIASSYTPDVLQGMRQAEANEISAPAEDASTTTPALTAIDNNPPAVTLTAAKNEPADQPQQQLPLFIALPLAFIFSLAVPFMGGISNIIGWLILGFGLWQAWSMNKRVPIEVSGPFTAGTTPPQAPLLQT